MKAVLAQAESYCVYVKLPNIMQHLHGIIPYMFDSWADPDAHLLLLKSSNLSSACNGRSHQSLFTKQKRLLLRSREKERDRVREISELASIDVVRTCVSML